VIRRPPETAFWGVPPQLTPTELRVLQKDPRDKGRLSAALAAQFVDEALALASIERQVLQAWSTTPDSKPDSKPVSHEDDAAAVEGLAKALAALQVALGRVSDLQLAGLDARVFHARFKAVPEARLTRTDSNATGELSVLAERVRIAAVAAGSTLNREIREAARKGARRRKNDSAADMFARQIAALFLALSGRVPPGSQGAWFAPFVAHLAVVAGLPPVGPRPVARAVAELRKRCAAHRGTPPSA
jgi:hypothetical protein